MKLFATLSPVFVIGIFRNAQRLQTAATTKAQAAATASFFFKERR
jgi:hypothetical protein